VKEWKVERSRLPFKISRALFGLLWILFFFTGVAQPSDPVDDLIVRGEKRLLEGELGQAAEDLEEALRLQPNNPRILSDLGRIYFHRQQYGEAERRIKEALSLDPQEGWLRCWSYNYLGRIYTVEKAFPIASVYFKEAASMEETAHCLRDAQEHLAYLRLVRYADERLTHQVRSDCCTLRYEPDLLDTKEAIFLSQKVQGYYEKIVRTLSLPLVPSGIVVYIYPYPFQYDLWEAKEILARNRPGEIHIFYDGRSEIGPVEHEMVHVLTSGLIGNRRLRALLAEGLAEYVVGSPWGISLDKWVKGFIKEGVFVPLTELWDDHHFRRTNPIVSYEEAGSFVKFLWETQGAEKVLRFIESGGSWQESFHSSLHDLEGAWIRAISALEVTPDEMELIRYRIWLGKFFNNQRLSNKRLPWVGITYYVSGDKVVIDRVAPLSPGEKAGLRPGDWVKEIDDIKITGHNPWKLAKTVHQKNIGDEISLTIEREGKEETLKILLERETGYDLQGEKEE